jgi:hypothetical protein
MNKAFFTFDGVHPLGDIAMHPPVPRSPHHAALLVLADNEPAASSPLQGAAQPEAEPVRAVQRRAGAFGAAALTLAWHVDHGTGGRIQLPFLG